VARRSFQAFLPAAAAHIPRAAALPVTAALAFVLALALAPAAADAGVDTSIATGPAKSRLRPAGAPATQPRPSDLPVSELGDRGDHDLYCPHALEPSPLVVIVPDRAQPRESVETLAWTLARAAFIVVVVDRSAGIGQGAKLSGVIDALTAADPLEPREAGCRLAPGVAAWGIGSGAAAALELAAIRATAGKPLAAVIAAFGTAQGPAAAQTTPTLVIAGEDGPATAPAPPSRWQLIVENADSCDLDVSYCRGSPIERKRGAVTDAMAALTSSQAATALTRAAVSWLRAQVEADPAEVVVLSSWQRRVPTDLPRHYNEPADDESPPAEPTPAEPTRRRITQFGVPLLAGRGTEGGGSYFWGVRPELVTSWTAELYSDGSHSWTGHGVGGYLEFVRGNDQTVVGGGLTYVHTRDPYSVAPSIGLYRSWSSEPTERKGVAASLYAGYRNFDAAPAALTFGLRVEVRRELNESADYSLLVSLELDIISGLIAILGATGSIQ
jgi:hypothetical protein